MLKLKLTCGLDFYNKTAMGSKIPQLIVAMAAVSGITAAESATVVVDAKTVIFAAGGNPNPDLQGLVPAAIPLNGGSDFYLTLSSVSGSISPSMGYPGFGADGGNFFELPYNVSSFAGIAGISDNQTGFTMPLVGVFTAGVPQPSTRPADRNVTTDKELSFVSTVLNQPFFIGDGMTAGGVRQLFGVPAGASHFSFGFADALAQFNIFHGPPGAYADNAGSLTVSYTFVPEPSTGALILLGLPMGTRRSRRCSANAAEPPTKPSIC